MRRLVLAGDAPPGQSALQLRPSRAAGRNGRRWGAGKPPETAGRKATGTKAFLSDAAASAALPYRQEPALVASDGICYVSLAANYKVRKEKKNMKSMMISEPGTVVFRESPVPVPGKGEAR